MTPKLTAATHNYYQATANPAPDHPALQGAGAADVCVIGGGVAGCSTALHLAQRGYRVVLLEAAGIGFGASGRSGGQLLPGYSSGQSPLQTQLGAQVAQQLWDLSVEAVQLTTQLIARHRIECDLHYGHLDVAIKPRQLTELRRYQHELEDRYQYRSLQHLDRSELRNWLASKRYCGGLHDSASAHVHPLNYTLGLAQAAVAAGATVHEHSQVLNITGDRTLHIHTAQGSITAKQAVLCCNAYVGALAPTLAQRIMPVGTYIIATESLGAERMQALMPHNVAVADTNFILDYFRRSADHRLLFGGRISYSGYDFRDTAAATGKRMLQVFPQLQDVRIEYSWGGLMDISFNRAPDFGRLQDNIYYLQGFSGHGMALAGLAGKLVAETIAGQAERFDLFARIRHRHFPGGQSLRTPALVLAMLWYRLRDLL
ncbi:MAG: NAD(P)/FAD-dependent oxidoreductase [Steroidobacteraceae bacterium]